LASLAKVRRPKAKVSEELSISCNTCCSAFDDYDGVQSTVEANARINESIVALKRGMNITMASKRSEIFTVDLNAKASVEKVTSVSG